MLVIDSKSTPHVTKIPLVYDGSDHKEQIVFTNLLPNAKTRNLSTVKLSSQFQFQFRHPRQNYFDINS